MRSKELDWAKLPTPETAKQRIQYSNACQNHFFEALVNPVAEKPSLRKVAGSGRVDPARFLAVERLLTLPEQLSFCCAVCGAASEGHEAAPLLANPYSRWAVLRCAACHE